MCMGTIWATHDALPDQFIEFLAHSAGALFFGNLLDVRSEAADPLLIWRRARADRIMGQLALSFMIDL